MRALAILLVFCLHSPYGLTCFPGGHVGVDVFLVLSGFLITSVLLNEWAEHGRYSLKRFYVRRLLRLTPALLACVGVVAAVEWWTGAGSGSDVWSYLRSVLLYYVNMAWLVGSSVLPGLIHTWSLSLEEQFYLVWPCLLAWLLGRSIRVAWLATMALFAASTLWQAYLSLFPNDARVYFCLDTRANAPLLGAALAMIPWLVSPQALSRGAGMASRLGGPAVLVLLASLVLVPHPNHGLHQPYTFPAVLAAAVLIFAFAFGPPTTLRGWFQKPLPVHLGKLSYSLYLWHRPIFYWITTSLMPERAWAVQTGVGAVLSFALATSSYRLIELPFLRLKARFTGHG